MDWIINFTPKILESWFLPLVSSIITIIVTRYTTKNITKNDRKLKINQKSFDQIYLPLHRQLKNLNDVDLYKTDALKLHNRIYVITERNYIYTNPILIKLLKDYKKLILSGKYKDCENKLTTICDHISKEYSRLRKYLNYPTVNLSVSFSSLDPTSKVLSILYLGILNMVLSFYFLIVATNINNKLLTLIGSWWFVISAILIIVTALIQFGMFLYSLFSNWHKRKKKKNSNKN